MSFSVTERIKIKVALGYPYKDTDTYDGLASAINYAEGIADLETYIRAQLAKIDSVVSALDSGVTAMSGLKSIDKGDVVWQDAKSATDPVSGALYSKGRRYIAQLSIALEVPILSDYFGSVGYLAEPQTTRRSCL
jgi:hypothetical protein